MFTSKTTRKERKIQKRIDQMQKEGYRLSRFDREGSSRMYAEAEKLTQQLIAIHEEKNSSGGA